ncbi:hypothetical protein L1987_70995 [Smallanthus sonchifolius]|uniref:Uncharacterized protein n=1 Tax=Smallanthus sonchifolius TaxID=185202 RepID=A0ACB9AQC9_9ASTR|nr:hypothetical protein L1987_70995 [Smallanthus sonchifolius]
MNGNGFSVGALIWSDDFDPARERTLTGRIVQLPGLLPRLVPHKSHITILVAAVNRGDGQVILHSLDHLGLSFDDLSERQSRMELLVVFIHGEPPDIHHRRVTQIGIWLPFARKRCDGGFADEDGDEKCDEEVMHFGMSGI